MIRYFLLSISCIALLASCDMNSCQDVACGYNQFCAGGRCYCNDGYEGSGCGNLSADKYVGSYLVYEYCTPASPFGPYNVNVNYGLQPNQITLSNLFNSGLSFTGVIRTDQTTNEGNALFIQDNQGGISCNCQGLFYVSAGRIDLQGSYTAGFDSYSCSNFTMYKQ